MKHSPIYDLQSCFAPIRDQEAKDIPVYLANLAEEYLSYLRRIETVNSLLGEHIGSPPRKMAIVFYRKGFKFEGQRREE